MKRSLFTQCCKFLTLSWFLNGCFHSNQMAPESCAKQLVLQLQKINPHAPSHEVHALSATLLQTYHKLQKDFKRTSSPKLHNILVNLSFKQKGLCYHFSDALYLALLRHAHLFKTFTFHLIVSHQGDYFQEHNALVVVARGQPLHKGLVIDGWRKLRCLANIRLHKDRTYKWRHRDDRCMCQRGI